MSDGPNGRLFVVLLFSSKHSCSFLGVRGNKFFDSTPAKAIPVSIYLHLLSPLTPHSQSATALGSTFDTELIQLVASKLLAPEAKLRAASVILGPTVNIQRVCLHMQPRKDLTSL